MLSSLHEVALQQKVDCACTCSVGFFTLAEVSKDSSKQQNVCCTSIYGKHHQPVSQRRLEVLSAYDELQVYHSVGDVREEGLGYPIGQHFRRKLVPLPSILENNSQDVVR